MITHAWRIMQIKGSWVILCLLCDRYSANVHDVAWRYCGYCHVFLDDLPEDYRRLRTGATSVTGFREDKA